MVNEYWEHKCDWVSCKDCRKYIQRHKAWQYVEKFGFWKSLVFMKKYIVYKPLCWGCYMKRT